MSVTSAGTGTGGVPARGTGSGADAPSWQLDAAHVAREAAPPGALQPAQIPLPVPGLEPPGGFDPVQALADMGGEQRAPGNGLGLSDQLLAWLAPRPRDPDTLTQARIVPLLGLAADMLAQASAADGGGVPPDIGRLGAAALEQELRLHRALADRRATLLRS